MNARISTPLILILLVSMTALAATAFAGEPITVGTSADFYSRYVWRGIDIAATPSLQPSMAVDYCGFEFGVWGAYTLSNQSSESDEIDFWLSYTHDIDRGASVTAIVTDYYFPNAGIDFFNFNNYDAMKNDTIPDPGAHTLEVGLSVTGPETFPITLSGYVNVYNDAGSNTYFQADFPVALNETGLTFFCGAAGGSKDNPDYYGTDEVAAINVGVTAERSIDVSETFSLPLSVSLIVNPKAEITYLVAGFSF